VKSADFSTELAAIAVEVDEAYPHKTRSVSIDELRQFIVDKLKKHNLLTGKIEEELNNPIVTAVIIIYGSLSSEMTYLEFVRVNKAVDDAWEYFDKED